MPTVRIVEEKAVSDDPRLVKSLELPAPSDMLKQALSKSSVPPVEEKAVSATPRTDSRIEFQEKDYPEWVDADLARSLERELIDAHRLLDDARLVIERQRTDRKQQAERAKSAERWAKENEKDAERVDWIEEDSTRIYDVGECIHSYSTVRQAIDAARNIAAARNKDPSND